MSITILTQPTSNAFIAANAPTWFRASSDAAETAYTITAIADDTGHVRLSVAASTGCAINNTVLIAGADTDFAYLNGRHNVLAVGTGTITIDLTYVSATTGTPGIATIQLEKFSMGVSNRFDIDGDLTDISTHYVPFLGGIGLKDVSKSISGIFESVFTLTAGWTSELNKCIYNIQTAVFEAALTAAYARVAIDSEVIIWNAVRSTDITGRKLEAGSHGKLLNGTTTVKVHAGTKVIMSMLTGDSVVSAYVGTTSPTTAAFTTDNFKGNFVYAVPTGYTSLQMYMIDSTATRCSEITTIQILPGCADKVYPIYFLNRYGGYDVYEFAEAVETNNTGNRIEVRGFVSAMGPLVDKDFSTENWQELRLIGRSEPAASVDYLKDLVTSSEIYNATGERVKLLTGSFVQTSRENVTPEFTILVSRGVVC